MDRLVKFFASFWLLIVAFFFGVLGTYSWLQTSFNVALNKEAVEERTFVIEKNDNLKVVSERLAEQNFIRSGWNVYFLSVLKEDERANRILPGEYRLSASLSPKEILERILSGQIFYRTLTIPEGKTSNEIAALIAGTEIATLAEVQKAMQSPQLMYANGVRTGSFEGYLFPDTYKFTKPSDTIEVIIKRMVDEGRNKIKQEIPDFNEKAINVGLTPQQVITLASIVEKETGKASERATIASVFHNRLRIGMPLQSDPTVIYGISNFDGNLTRAHLQDRENPYNTYVHPDLPPTAICNPGIESIKAVLNPADTDYLYFVSKNDGSHHFSSSYKEHREAVTKYQKGGGEGL